MSFRIRFEPLREDDLPMLVEWFARPHVLRWWHWTPDAAELREEYLAEPSDVRGFIASEGQRPFGFVQSYVVMGAGGGWWPDETDPGARGIDQFLADEADLGRGLGRAMVRAFVEDVLFADPVVTQVQIDPEPSNERAIRAYAAAGFVAEREVDTPDGRALLMRRRRELSAARGT